MDQWIVLFYVALVLAGARIVEFVAKKHFERARDFAVRELTTSRRRTNTAAQKANISSCSSVTTENRLAVYQIRTSCQFCRLKASCAPHSESPTGHAFLLAGVDQPAGSGQFHRRISVIMFLAGTILCAVCLLLWAGKPGTGLFVIAQVVSVDFLIHEIRAVLESPVRAVTDVWFDLKMRRSSWVSPL